MFLRDFLKTYKNTTLSIQNKTLSYCAKYIFKTCYGPFKDALWTTMYWASININKTVDPLIH